MKDSRVRLGGLARENHDGTWSLAERCAEHVAFLFSLWSPWSRLPARWLAPFPFPLTPLPLNSRKRDPDLMETAIPQSPPALPSRPCHHKKPRHQRTCRSNLHQHIASVAEFDPLQAQSGHTESPQCDGVLPPTRAACMLSLPVSRPSQSATRFAHTFVTCRYFMVHKTHKYKVFSQDTSILYSTLRQLSDI